MRDEGKNSFSFLITHHSHLITLFSSLITRTSSLFLCIKAVLNRGVSLKFSV